MVVSMIVDVVKGRIEMDRLHFARLVQRVKDGSYELVLRRVQDKRSTNANRYYWGVVLTLIAEHTGDDVEDLHDIYTNLFCRRVFVHLDRRTGEVSEQVIVGRTSRMTVSEFYRYVERVRQHAAEFHRVDTPDPDPEYRRYRAAAFAEAA